MKKFFWLVIGIGVGFIVAHQVNKTRAGKEFFENIDARAREFGDAVSDGYHKREAELRRAIGDA